MIWILNRREVMITFSMKKQAEIKDLLSRYNIAYTTKTTNLLYRSRMGSSRARTINLGHNSDYTYEYKIYVKRKDYDKAKAIIDGKIR